MSFVHQQRTLLGVAFSLGLLVFASCNAEPKPLAEENGKERLTNRDSESAAMDRKTTTSESGDEPTHVVPTAEEYLQRLNASESVYSLADPQLPAAELVKVAAALRQTFPLKSLSDRLHFQSIQPPAPEWDRIAPLFFATGNETREAALRALHSSEVEAFINRSGQGMFRSRPVLPGDLYRSGEYVRKLDTVPVGSDLLAEPTIELASLSQEAISEESPYRRQATHTLSENGMPTRQLVELFHQQNTLLFADPGSLGFVKSVEEVAGFESHQIRLGVGWSRNMRVIPDEDLGDLGVKADGLRTHWKVNRLQLVSLLMHESPAVYVSENLPDMEEMRSADAETRGLNSFEIEGLEKLVSGEELHAIATENRIVMVGAIRASERCLQCHSVQENDLLGAFSYEFLRTPRVKKTPLRFKVSGILN